MPTHPRSNACSILCRVTRSTPTDLLSARLQGAAQRLAGWEPPVGQERQVAIHDLQQIAGNNIDAYAQAAGIMLGTHPPGDTSHAMYQAGADLILDAGGLAEDDERVQAWVAAGEEHREKARAAHAAGDVWGRTWTPGEE